MASLFSNYRLLKDSGLFDETYYCNAYPEVRTKNLDPLLHYLETGALELRNPSATFNARKYVRLCQERGEHVENPLLHYIETRGAEGLRSQPQEITVPPTLDDKSRKLPTEMPEEADFLLNLDRVRIECESGTERLTGYGWCLASSPVVEFGVKVGSLAARARYGLPRADVARRFPQALKADHCGFEFTLDPVPKDQAGTVELVFTARTAAGATQQKSVSLDLGAIRAEPETGDAAAGWAADKTGFSRPPMQLQIDSAQIDAEGILRIVGWVVCLAPIASVQVFVDDQRLGTAAHGKARDDVAAIHPDYPNARNSGFVLRADASLLAAGDRVIRVQAIASTGISRESVLPLRVSGNRRPSASRSKDSKVDCFCDLLDVTTRGQVSIKGWAVGAAATERILVLLDDREIGEAEISLERPDVGNLFPTFVHARRAGFAFRHSGTPVSAGEHLIVLRHRADGEETDVLLPVLAIEASSADTPPAASSGTTSKDVLLNIDQPEVVDGAAVVTVRGDLEIAGWALARKGVAAIDIAIDGRVIKSVRTGIHRRDVQRVFPDREGAARAGFSALLPKRSLGQGRHQVSIAVRDRAEQSARSEFHIEVDDVSDTEGPWSLRRRMTPAEVAFRARPLLEQTSRPSFAVIMPLPAGAEALRAARVTLASLARQVYESWSLWIFPRQSEEKALWREILDGFDELTERVDLVTHERAVRWLQRVDGAATHLIVVRPGDELGCDALLEYAAGMILDPGADFIYADERRSSPYSGKVEAFFKPQWSPDLLLSQNYVGRAWCARKGLFRRARIRGGEIASACDFDLALRLTEQARAIHHLPLTLLQAAAPQEDEAVERKALKRALDRRAIAATVKSGRIKGTFRVRRKLTTRGLVSIIIPTCAARGLIRKCIETLRALTAHRRFEIVCIENIPPDKQEWKKWLRANADKVIETTEPFNWSRFNNLAAAAARGEFLLFLNDDIGIIDRGWLEAMLEQAQRSDVGAVGAQLLYPDRRVQHAGMFLARLGVARHAFRYADENSPGYFGLALTQREVIAVTGACLMTRRETFEALGGFDETHDIINNDVDYCLRSWRKGLRSIYTPHARLIHHELASRSEVGDDYDAAGFERKWRNVFMSGDPFFNPRLTKDRDDYAIEWEPVEAHCAGYPVFVHNAIRRILVVKLDHIGDCVISLPAVRRLKRHFPSATLSVLTGHASKAVWALEPVVDEVIEFDLFHARSASGLVERTEDDWRALHERLAPKRFDLAIDLRRHVESRPILRYTGARYLAGFDSKGKFPWLDIAIEAAEDSPLLHKRQHTADDLVNLVDALGAASEESKAVLSQQPRAMSAADLAGVPNARGIFRKRVICVHPAAGNEMRQWPPEYFGLLINQLVELENIHVIIIGAPEDAELGKTVLKGIVNRKAVWSLIGKVKLNELPGLLARCALFVGNNSGPQHIAAGLGVPTVGIHSGVVDAREWGPRGVNAIALQRAMSCSPCYHAKRDECARGLACLRGLLPADVAAACQRLLATSTQELKQEEAVTGSSDAVGCRA